MKRILILIGFTVLVFNCTSVSEEDLIDIPPPPPTFTTYDVDVKPIMDTNCIICHSDPPINGAPIHLISYDAVKNAVNNSNLISRISAQAGDSGAMPFGGPRLPQNLIDIVVQWQTDGLLEN